MIILSTAGLAITWCTYQSTLWSGIQTFKLAGSNASFRQAQEKKEELMQRIVRDQGLVISIGNAIVAGDTTKMQFFIKRVRPELAALLDAWAKTDPLHNENAPLHPGEMPEYRKFLDERNAEIRRLKKQGDNYFDQAQRANEISDNYVLLTVVFSVVMFLCGVAPKKASVRLAFALNMVSAIICLILLVILFFAMPMATE